VKLFLDSANLAHIREIASWGVLDGVTTNPTLVAKEGRDFKETILEICSIVNGPISAEVVSTDSAGRPFLISLTRSIPVRRVAPCAPVAS